MATYTDEQLGRRLRLYLAAALISDGRDRRETDHLIGYSESLNDLAHFVFSGLADDAILDEAFVPYEQVPAGSDMGWVSAEEAAAKAEEFAEHGYDG